MSSTIKGTRLPTKTTETILLARHKEIIPVIEEFRDYDSPLLFRTAIQIALDNLLENNAGILTNGIRGHTQWEIRQLTNNYRIETENTFPEIVDSVVELTQLFWRFYRYELRNRYIGFNVEIAAVELRRDSLVLQMEIADG